MTKGEVLSGSTGVPALTRFLIFISSVRLGIILLMILGVMAFLGMVVTQQGVDGFAAYYTSLTPAQQSIYERLGFFNIYNSFYFSLVLYALCLNIILATIERVPKVWRYISDPAVVVPVRWLRNQELSGKLMQTSKGDPETMASIQDAMSAAGLRNPKIRKHGSAVYFFSESGSWNRLAFCAVHAALLTVFLGYFLTSKLAESGTISLSPGRSTNIMFDRAFGIGETSEIAKKLPFTITFTDTQRMPIDARGPLTPENSLNWKTSFTIADESGVRDAAVELNRPYDYRGYRFFQSSMSKVGRARKITLELTQADGVSRTLNLARDGNILLEDGTEIHFAGFRANFRSTATDINEDSTDYPNPAAIVNIKLPSGVTETIALPASPNGEAAVSRSIGPYSFQLLDYERVAHEHSLAVRRDPGSGIIYFGCALLSISLAGVFFFSHQRFWVVLQAADQNSNEIIYAGNTNRNSNTFGTRFARFQDELKNRIYVRTEDRFDGN